MTSRDITDGRLTKTALFKGEKQRERERVRDREREREKDCETETWEGRKEGRERERERLTSFKASATMGWQNPCEVDRHDPEPGRSGKTLVRWIDVIWDQDGVAKPL